MTENDDNNKLNEAIGKHCLERYLKRIIKESEAYENVTGEVEYWFNKNRILSSDIIARSNEKVLLLENKFLRPKLALRYIDEAAIASTVKRLVSAIEQLFRAMKNYHLYDPFSIQRVDEDTLWGVIIVFEDTFISRRQCMEEAAKKTG